MDAEFLMRLESIEKTLLDLAKEISSMRYPGGSCVGCHKDLPRQGQPPEWCYTTQGYHPHVLD